MKPSRILVFAALALCLSLPRPSLPATLPVKIIAANLSSGNGQAYELPGIRIFQGLDPDIVLIQEFNYESGTRREFVNTAFGAEYYYYVETGTGKDIPNGIISRWPFITPGGTGYWVDDEVPNRAFAWAKIDLPGDHVLQVVSVHLLTADSSVRNREATTLKGYIALNFDSGDFIVVGGDLNTTSPTESCITTFAEFLSPTTHRPVDQKGDDDTNSPRNNPYDWVMENSVLQSYYTSTTLEGHTFTHGLVYDSRITLPYSMLPSPILSTDSDATGMQHMAVIKTFNIPVDPSPTPTPTITPTPSPTPTSLPVVLAGGDYDGDGTSDIAVFRPTSGMWAIRGFTNLYFGSSSDFPAPGDYDGDGTTDAAVFRPSQGLWSVRNVTRVYFGVSGDRPVPGDYNGDGRADIGVFRSSQSQWAIYNLTRWYFGAASDHPAPGDYDGDGTADIALFRKSAGMWAVSNVSRVYFGGEGDLPVAADYSGDGFLEYAVYRPYYGLWSVKDYTRLYIGGNTYLPLPGDYDGNASDEPALFRPSNGLWTVSGITRAYFGTAGDIPVAR
jgi:endonuclease/exonuclease/phosphatase family metal-dependent hydrolase